MSKLPKKYIPYCILIFLVLFIWLKEAIIGEGYFNNYYHLPEHKVLLLFSKGLGKIIILSAGYYGLSTLPVKWVKDVWLYWYILAFLVEVLSITLNGLMNSHSIYNFLDFLNSTYYINTTPFPYLFLWLLSGIVARMKLSKKPATAL
jgi:hypothetical protein